jgi:hypothetical protein
MNEYGHYWSYCHHCRARMVICGRCGNNCCNGGYGEEIGPEPGTTMKCRACPSAYDMQDAGEQSTNGTSPKA